MTPRIIQVGAKRMRTTVRIANRGWVTQSGARFPSLIAAIVYLGSQGFDTRYQEVIS